MHYLNRIERFRHYLSYNKQEALLIEHPLNIFYLTGIELSLGKLLITADTSALIVDGRYFEVCVKQSPCPVFLLDDMPLFKWLFTHSIKTLMFESEFTYYSNFQHLQKTIQELQTHNHLTQLVPISSPVLKQRWIKDDQEIMLLKEAAWLGYQGYLFVCSLLKEGITETEIALELEFFWKRKGAKKLAFDPIIAFGANSSMPHYRAGSTLLQQGMPVLIDIGVVWQHYHSDMTRVVLFGDVHPKIREIYQIVEEAKNRALASCKPGTLIKDLDRIARDYIASYGYESYFTHSLGHGIGLDIHEPPTLRQTGIFKDSSLEPGITITIEPGIYLSGIGGVRLEDTILITEKGYENLSAFDLS